MLVRKRGRLGKRKGTPRLVQSAWSDGWWRAARIDIIGIGRGEQSSCPLLELDIGLMR